MFILTEEFIDDNKNNISSERTDESTVLPYSICSTEEKKEFSKLRQIGFNLRALVGDYRFIARRLAKEFRAMFHTMDLILVASGFIIVVIILFLGMDVILPEIIRAVMKQAAADSAIANLKKTSTFRLIAGIGGAFAVFIRLIMKKPVMKFIRKSVIPKELTYIFGSTPYAEQLLKQMIWEYAYEEKVALISDKDLLWVKSISAWMDTIWVNPLDGISNLAEFSKEWFYDKVTFKNAVRVFILTDSIELNQNILTNIRRLRPTVPIYILKNYAPTFLKTEKLLDPNIHIIDDIDSITAALVLSLSLDIKWPKTAEINVPVTYYKSPAKAITAEVPKVEVLAVKRNGTLLPTETILQRDDRILVWYSSKFNMKRASRVAQEFLIQPWPPKVKSQKEEVFTKEETDQESDEIGGEIQQ